MKTGVRIILIAFLVISFLMFVYQVYIGEPFKEPFHSLVVITVFMIMSAISVIIAFVDKNA